jgi:hypothetical protein
MLGRTPRLPHGTMRWLIIALMIINGAQLVLLQGVIDATLSLEFTTTWTYVAISFVGLLLTGALLAYAFARGKPSDLRVRGTGEGGRGTVSGEEVRAKSGNLPEKK